MLVSVLVLSALVANAQVCRLSVAGLNRNRRVLGPVHAECPGGIHTPPFGNWGVSSNFAAKQDGHQFDGWCHNARICDNNGNCRMDCLDGWYEWNSCTDAAEYKAPNCTLYNSANCTGQVTATGVNVHGTKTVDIPVRCPADVNGDTISDEGGCADLRSYSTGLNFLSLYELDPLTGDDLIQTIYYADVVLPLTCNLWSCKSVGSAWATPISYDSPASPAKVYAEAAVVINSGTFINTVLSCRAVGPALRTVNGASISGGSIAPESIVSIFGSGLSTTSAAVALPATVLGDTQVLITDSAGVRRNAPLFYVSPNQINLQVPASTAIGNAGIQVRRGDGVISNGTRVVTAVAPGLFTANATGSGVASATAVAVLGGGTQRSVPVYTCGTAPGSCVPVPVDVSMDTVVLSLYGTGIRRNGGLSTVAATIGGVPAQVLYAGSQFQYPGLDQVNLVIPRSLRGRGVVNVILTVGGIAANPVTISVQ